MSQSLYADLTRAMVAGLLRLSHSADTRAERDVQAAQSQRVPVTDGADFNHTIHDATLMGLRNRCLVDALDGTMGRYVINAQGRNALRCLGYRDAADAHEAMLAAATMQRVEAQGVTPAESVKAAAIIADMADDTAPAPETAPAPAEVAPAPVAGGHRALTANRLEVLGMLAAKIAAGEGTVNGVLLSRAALSEQRRVTAEKLVGLGLLTTSDLDGDRRMRRYEWSASRARGAVRDGELDADLLAAALAAHPALAGE